MSVLVRTPGDLGLAEEAVQDVCVEAVRRWPVDRGGGLLRRLNRSAEAASAYEAALRTVPRDADRAVLRELLDG